MSTIPSTMPAKSTSKTGKRRPMTRCGLTPLESVALSGGALPEYCLL